MCFGIRVNAYGIFMYMLEGNVRLQNGGVDGRSYQNMYTNTTFARFILSSSSVYYDGGGLCFRWRLCCGGLVYYRCGAIFSLGQCVASPCRPQPLHVTRRLIVRAPLCSLDFRVMAKHTHCSRLTSYISVC